VSPVAQHGPKRPLDAARSAREPRVRSGPRETTNLEPVVRARVDPILVLEVAGIALHREQEVPAAASRRPDRGRTRSSGDRAPGPRSTRRAALRRAPIVVRRMSVRSVRGRILCKAIGRWPPRDFDLFLLPATGMRLAVSPARGVAERTDRERQGRSVHSVVLSASRLFAAPSRPRVVSIPPTSRDVPTTLRRSGRPPVRVRGLPAGILPAVVRRELRPEAP
jgi:hypothetical protein